MFVVSFLIIVVDVVCVWYRNWFCLEMRMNCLH